jgi:HD-GYP domain-containing protein (c-di-GMP phosphodiesterase class II)
LKGDEISLQARILAVADTIEAMATHRPYRPARGLSAAMDEIRAEAGVKLDSKVVDAAFGLMDEDNTLQKLTDAT